MTVFVHFRGMKTANRRMCTRGADVFSFVRAARTDVRDAMLCGSRRPVHARRLSAAPHLGGSLFLGTLYMVHTSCVSNTPFPGWGFRRLRAGGNDFQKDRHPLRWFLSSWDSIFRPFWDTSAHGTQAFLFVLGTEKRNGSTATT